MRFLLRKAPLRFSGRMEI